MKGRRVAVIGGGPVGVLSAAHFARRGAHVTVYERRTPREQNAPGLGWSIAIGDVATGAMEAAGLSADFGPAGRAEGGSAHVGLREPRYIGNFAKGGPPRASKFTLTRAWIIDHLRKQCELQYPSLVAFKDGYSLVGGNLHRGEAILSPVAEHAQARPRGGSGGASESDAGAAAGSVRVEADIIVAADGAGSKARQLLQALDSDLRVRRCFSEVETLPFAIETRGEDPKSFGKLETPSGRPFWPVPEGHGPQIVGGFAAFCMPVPEAPRGLEIFILGCRKGGADVNASLSCWTDWWHQERSQEELQNILESSFPQVPRTWLESCAKACRESKQRITTSFVECSQLGSGRCVLIGDAAHALSPNVGLGLTAGLEDAALLSALAAELVTAADQPSSKAASATCACPLEGLAAAWTRTRLTDALAYTQISKSVNDVTYFKYHRDWGRLARALPVGLARILAQMQFPGRGVMTRLIAPAPAVGNALMNGGMTPTEVQRIYYTSFYKAVGVVGAMAAGLSALGAQVATVMR